MINYKIYAWNEKRKKYIQLFKGKDKYSVVEKFNKYYKNLVDIINKSWGHGADIDLTIQSKYHQITNEDHKPYIMDITTQEKEFIYPVI